MGRVFHMVIWSGFRVEEYRDNDHSEGAPHLMTRDLLWLNFSYFCSIFSKIFLIVNRRSYIYIYTYNPNIHTWFWILIVLTLKIIWLDFMNHRESIVRVAILFLKSISERDGSDIERLIWARPLRAEFRPSVQPFTSGYMFLLRAPSCSSIIYRIVRYDNRD